MVVPVYLGSGKHSHGYFQPIHYQGAEFFSLLAKSYCYVTNKQISEANTDLAC